MSISGMFLVILGMSTNDISLDHSKGLALSFRQYLTTKQDVIWKQQDVICPIHEKEEVVVGPRRILWTESRGYRATQECDTGS